MRDMKTRMFYFELTTQIINYSLIRYASSSAFPKVWDEDTVRSLTISLNLNVFICDNLALLCAFEANSFEAPEHQRIVSLQQLTKTKA